MAKFSKKIKKAKTKLYNLHAWGEGDLENVFGKLSLLEVEEINKYIKEKQKLFSEIIEKNKIA